MKNILLISNISADNKQLLEYTARFSKHYKCKLHILHITNDQKPVLISSPYSYERFDIDYKKSESNKIAQKVMNTTEKILEREFIQVKIQTGNQDKILKTFITQNFIDLIVLGNKDLNEDSDFLDQKNVLMNVISTPLLIVPQNEIFKEFEKFNFLTTHSEKDMDHLINLSDQFPESIIKMTHINSSGMDDIETKKNSKWVLFAKDKIGERLSYQIIEEKLEKYIKYENLSITKSFDAFVLSSEKRNFWKRLFNPSTTLGFLANLEMPSIIYKNYTQDN